MDDEYGVVLASPPGGTGETVYLQAVDDEHVMLLVTDRWERDDVTAVFHFPRGHQAGTQRKVWPKLVG